MADERPRWREDFPVRWDEDHYMTRRELAKFLTLGSGLLASVNVLIAFIGLNATRSRPPPCSESPDADDIRARRLAPVPLPDRRTTPAFWCATLGQARRVLAGLHPSVVRGRAPAGRRRALACPCHKGSFSARDGHPLAGPPTRRLPRIVIEQRGDEIVATGIEV